MTTPLAMELGHELDAIDARYRGLFLTRWRGAHDPAALEALISRTRSLLTTVNQFPIQVRGTELSTIAGAARQRVQSLESERAAIDRFRRLTPAEHAIGTLAHAARLRNLRISRHFNEHEMATADLPLLRELADDLRTLRDVMTERFRETGRTEAHPEIVGVERLLSQIESRIQAESERRAARDRFAHAKDVVARAKLQIDLLDATLAHPKPMTRRPGLLARILVSLRELADEVQSVSSLVEIGSGISRDALCTRAHACEAALARLREMRASTPLTELVGALEEAAESIIDDYERAFHGKTRTSVDRALLGSMCDELHELQRQMADFATAHRSEESYERLWMTSKRLMILEAEHSVVSRAQAPQLVPLVLRDAPSVPWVVEESRDRLAAGEFPLLPLQQKILSLPHAHYWSLPLVCEIDQSISRDQVDEVFRALLARHDGLRARFSRDVSGAWHQHIDPVGVDLGKLAFWCDLSAHALEKMDHAISGVLARMAREDRLAQGGLCRLVVFDRGDQRKRVLVLLAHHLVVDMASLSLLFLEMCRALECLSRGEPITFHSKTTPTRAWSEALAALGGSDALMDAEPAWRAELERVKSPFGAERRHDPHEPVDQFELPWMDRAQADRFFREAPAAYDAPLDRMLAAGFAQALARWQGITDVAFTWIHNGRSSLPTGNNLNRTVGAFISDVPVAVRVDPTATPAKLVSSFRAQHADLGARGVEYNALAFFGRDPALRCRLQRHPALQIRLNYFGHLGRVFGADGSPQIALHREQWQAPLACACSRFPWRLYVHARRTADGVGLGCSSVGLAKDSVRGLGEIWRETMLRFGSRT